VSTARGALESLAASEGSAITVLVVDNNGRPDAAAALLAMVSDLSGAAEGKVNAEWTCYGGRGAIRDVQVAVLQHNDGYAAACNVGFLRAQQLRARYVWFLNNDIRVDTKACSLLAEFMDRHERAGLAGCTILTRERSRIECVGGARLGRWTLRCRFVTSSCDRIDYVSGAAMFARAAAVEHVGGLPDQYFLFFEDAAFSYRLLQAGYELAVVADAQATHLGGKTTGSRGAPWRRSALCTYYSSRNAIWFAREYRSALVTASVVASRAALCAVLLLGSPRNGIAASKGLFAGVAGRRGTRSLPVRV